MPDPLALFWTRAPGKDTWVVFALRLSSVEGAKPLPTEQGTGE